MEEYRVQYTLEAEEDLIRLYQFFLNRENFDYSLAERALTAIESAIQQLRKFPYNCRKATTSSSYIREVIIPFASTGYLAIYEINPVENTVTILAVRHQREDDYH